MVPGERLNATWAAIRTTKKRNRMCLEDSMQPLTPTYIGTVRQAFPLQKKFLSLQQIFGCVHANAGGLLADMHGYPVAMPECAQLFE